MRTHVGSNQRYKGNNLRPVWSERLPNDVPAFKRYEECKPQSEQRTRREYDDFSVFSVPSVATYPYESRRNQRTRVMKIDQRVNLIRRYLLGELTEADQAALEQELLLDRGQFDRVWAVENDLVDSYVRGEMSRADRERFEGHYLASPLHRERAAIAESFLTDFDQSVGETVEARAKEPFVPWRRRFTLRSPRPIFGVVLVIALFLTFSLVWS
jgi:hypothetical protein